ncbi:MAG: hypothetical protein JWQ42_3450 [Edaphobacter sp.]|nr:hypothetical protein [Edaphobacter sp.]
MVARYYEAGLEIILDMTNNHTAEGNEKAGRSPRKASITPATMAGCLTSRATT